MCGLTSLVRPGCYLPLPSLPHFIDPLRQLPLTNPPTFPFLAFRHTRIPPEDIPLAVHYRLVLLPPLHPLVHEPDHPPHAVGAPVDLVPPFAVHDEVKLLAFG